MDLHRTTGTPDWETIADDKRTAIQKVAAKTGGIVTPPNIISVVGLGMVVYGLVVLLQQEYWLGLTLLVVGRFLDIVDGVVAQKTGTKSPLGELIDASIDKIGTLLTIIVLYVAAISQWWLITALLLPQVLISLVILYKRLKKKTVHPTLAGKLSMGALWVAIAGLIMMNALALTAIHPFSVTIYLISAVSVGLGCYALWQYSIGRD